MSKLQQFEGNKEMKHSFGKTAVIVGIAGSLLLILTAVTAAAMRAAHRKHCKKLPEGKGRPEEVSCEGKGAER